MVEPDKIRGYIGAHDQLQPPKEEVTDPEKFKKVLKVEASTESEKREQRKKKRSEHEGEEEGDIGPSEPEKPVVETAFTEVMEGKPEKEDLLSGQTGITRTTELKGTDADLGYDETGGQGLRKTIYSAPGQTGFEEAAPPPEEEAPAPSAPPPSTPQPPQMAPPPPSSGTTQPPPPSSGQTEQQTPLGPPTTGEEGGAQPPTLAERRKAHAAQEEKKIQAQVTGLPQEKKRVETYKEKKLREKYEQLEKAHAEKEGKPSTQPSKEGALSKIEKAPKGEKKEGIAAKPTPTPEIEKKPTKKEEPTTAPLTRSPSEKQQPAQPSAREIEAAAPLPPEGVLSRQKPLSRRKTTMTAMGESVEKPTIKKGPTKGEGSGPGGEKRGKREDTDAILDEIAASIQPEMTQHFTPVETEKAPESKLSPQVYELFEKMVGFITIQKINGVERTTVTIDMKGSIFNGAELILDRSSTAQDTFNIELKASPEAVALFNQNAADLAAAFQKKDFDFRVNIKRASIHKRYAVQKGRGSASS